MLERGALAFKDKDLVLQEGSLAFQKGRLAQLQEDGLANPEEEPLAQLGDQTLALQGGKTHLTW